MLWTPTDSDQTIDGGPADVYSDPHNECEEETNNTDQTTNHGVDQTSVTPLWLWF